MNKHTASVMQSLDNVDVSPSHTFVAIRFSNCKKITDCNSAERAVENRTVALAHIVGVDPAHHFDARPITCSCCRALLDTAAVAALGIVGVGCRIAFALPRPFLPIVASTDQSQCLVWRTRPCASNHCACTTIRPCPCRERTCHRH